MFALAIEKSNAIKLFSADFVEISELKGHHHRIRTIEFSRDQSNLLASGGDDRTAKIWNISSQIATASFEHPDTVWRVCFSNGNEFIVTLDAEGIIRKWVLSMGSVVWQLGTSFELDVECLLFPDDSRVISCGRDPGYGKVFLGMWDLATGADESNCLIQRVDFSSTVRSFSLSPNGDSVVLGLDDGSVVMYALENGLIRKDTARIVRSCSDGNDDSAVQIEYTYDTTRVLCCTVRAKIFVWEVASGLLLRMLDADDFVYRACFDMEGEKVLLMSDEEGIPTRVINIHSGIVLLAEERVTAGAFCKPNMTVLM